MKQFIYVLKLIPEMLEEANWTSKEEALVDMHFRNLKVLLDQGKLVLAGKTEGLNADTFGIVILEVETDEEATRIMETDPAVAGGLMTATLFPYHVALIRSVPAR